MPAIVKIAYIVAFVIAGLAVVSALVLPIVVLPLALIPLIAGIGIMRRRAWSAYGFALYQGAQLLLMPLLFLRLETGRGAMFVQAAFEVALVVVFVLAGRSLAAAGGKMGLAWPWIAVAVLTSVPLIFVQAYVMPTSSMEETLLVGDRLFVQRFPKPAIERGEVIVFRFPIDRSQTYVKRVIGAPGDRIRITNKVLYRNGAALQEPYAVHKTDFVDDYRDNFPSQPNGPAIYPPALEMLKNNVVNGEVVVPEGKYFVLGDNRDMSLDSRYWGFVSAGDLIGKPVLIYDSKEQPAGQLATATPSPGLARTRWDRLFKRL